MLYNIVSRDEERQSVTVFFEGGGSQVATKEHPNFNTICEAVESGVDDPEAVRDLFDVGYAIDRRFQALSDRVAYASGRILFDGEEVDNALTQAIVTFFSAGNDDFQPLVNFMEKIATNPSPHSQENLYRWLRNREFAIHPDGDFIAYKGVAANLGSQSTGVAYVNGQRIEGSIPNIPDTVISMPRSEVTFDPANGCSTGLHAAHWKFARSFSNAGIVVALKINPRDVVSVPVDSQDDKVRVCRYRVLSVVEGPIEGVLYLQGDPERTARVVARVAAEQPERIVEAAIAGTRRPHKVRDSLIGAKLPTSYEEFRKADFEKLGRRELRGIANTWGVSQGRNKATLIYNLAREAQQRRAAEES